MDIKLQLQLLSRQIVVYLLLWYVFQPSSKELFALALVKQAHHFTNDCRVIFVDRAIFSLKIGDRFSFLDAFVAKFFKCAIESIIV
jgi:hypothetical protein